MLKIVASAALGFLACALSSASASAARSSTANAGATRLILDSETTWVRAGSGFSLGLSLDTPLPLDDFSIEVEVYPRLLSRYALNHPPAFAVPTTTITGIPLLPTATSGISNYTLSPIGFRVAVGPGPAGGPKAGKLIDLDCGDGTCDGVYPLRVELINGADGAVAATLATDLVYVAANDRPVRLKVGLVLPLGSAPSVSATGSPTLSAPAIAQIGSLLRYLAAHRNAPVSLEVYPQLLQALQLQAATGAPRAARVASRTAHEFEELVSAGTRDGDVELLPATTVPIDLSSLAASLGPTTAASEFVRQVATANVAFGQDFSLRPDPGIYVSPTSFNAVALHIASASGVCDIVLPSTNVNIANQIETATTPFVIPTPGSPCRTSGLPNGPVVFAADVTLAQHFASSGTAPVLAAHLLLADLAQTYFENPYPTEPRGVVVAPTAWAMNPEFTATLLAGLANSPVLLPSTVRELISAIPAGADHQPTTATLTPPVAGPSVSATALRGARHLLAVLQLIMPQEPGVLEGLTLQLLASEATGITDAERSADLAAPRATLDTIARSVQIFGSAHITLTSASGQIPITIRLTGNLRPLHVELRLRSSSLDIPRSEVVQHLTLELRDTEDLLKVSARTSGRFTFTVQLVAPDGSTQLLAPTTYIITSTAASGVAIALSLLALAVLAAWWARSAIRHRRRAVVADSEVASNSGAT